MYLKVSRNNNKEPKQPDANLTKRLQCQFKYLGVIIMIDNLAKKSNVR